MANEDLWGALPDVGNLRTPSVVLKEQAELLKEKTKGLLVGEIRPSQQGTRFSYELQIVAPTLAQYKYAVLSVTHDIGFYPLVLRDARTTVKETCTDEAEFVSALRVALTSESTRDVIARLLTHIKAEA